jgi:hypothetical protein
MKAPLRYCNKSVAHIKWSVCKKSLQFLDNRICILKMFNISPAAAQHCAPCRNRHDFVSESFVQIFINIYYMQFIYRKMLTHMAVKWWTRLESILLIRLACIPHDIMNVPITKTHSPTYSQTDRKRKKESSLSAHNRGFILCTSRHIGHNWWTGVQNFQYKHNFSFSLQCF